MIADRPSPMLRGTSAMNPHPMRKIGLILLSGALIAPIDAPAWRASGQDVASPPKETKERAAQLAEMKQIVGSLKIVAIDDQGKETPATMSEEPAHRWTDPTRDFSGGALWVWKAGGRPVAVVGAELYTWWSLEFVSVSPGLVRADGDRVRWRPREGVEFREIADAPAPETTEAGRFRQMRDLARRFSPHEYWLKNEGNVQRYALRLLPHPIDRYSDPASGVVDGGLFVGANGTNPELLLLIEARRRGDGPPKWSFAAAQFSHAEVSLKLGARDVWTAPSKDAGQPATPNDPYYDVLVPRRYSTRELAPTKKAKP
jgi:hypothetical protein